ncbi:DUF1428 domain-containing protein [uncultured Sphingomonas sp.]|uniref:DUF1428 domain-containing protein n=1 Tax=uncultured Sphingomonas sp. TaxID=158754 RepID=UPI0026386B34|nr:DUF1428 domain-containing protein [uncultured Sphingomonas sp.]
MGYVQGFVIPVPVANREAYRDMAARTAPVFQDYGAERIVECWGDALPDGQVTDFHKAVKAEATENVVFSWIVWPDKATCDAAHDKIWSDPRMMTPDRAIPFDGKRMIYGGFVPIFDTQVV